MEQKIYDILENMEKELKTIRSNTRLLIRDIDYIEDLDDPVDISVLEGFARKFNENFALMSETVDYVEDDLDAVTVIINKNQS